MILCDDGHDDICYEHGECPLCRLIAELEGAEYEIRELECKIDDLECELNNLSE